MLARLFDFELCRIYMQPGKPYSFSLTGAYPCVELEDGAGFHQNLHKDLANVDYRWAFERGDECVVNFDEGAIVGYSFTSSLPTRVIEEVEFFFPEWCRYIFADVTTTSYRGLRLAKDRWIVRRDANRKNILSPRASFTTSMSPTQHHLSPTSRTASRPFALVIVCMLSGVAVTTAGIPEAHAALGSDFAHGEKAVNCSN